MAEGEEFEGLNENQMELLLESDEEEASLIEEMEKHTGNFQSSIVTSNSEGSLSIRKRDLELTGLPKDVVSFLEADENAAKLIEDIERHEGNNVSHEFMQTLEAAGSNNVLDGKSSSGEGYMIHVGDLKVAHHLNSKERATDLQALQEKVLQSILGTEGAASSSVTESEPAETESNNDSVQILQLDMSANELILAKSAASFKYHDRTFPAEKALTSERLVKVPYILQDLPSPGNNLVHNTADNMDPEKLRELNLIKRILKPEGKKFERTTTLIHPKALTHSSKRKKVKDSSRKRKTVAEVDKGDLLKAKKLKLQAEPESSTAAVSFYCNGCDFKCPFIKEKVDDIVEHLTPSERYHQLYKVPPKLKSYKENVKLSVMVAKNKSKAQVRLLNRLECISCHQHFPFDVEAGDQIVTHYHWCRKVQSGSKSLSCLFCEELIARGTIRKHLSPQSRKQCPINVASTLQLMSCVCKKYAERHKPVCVVCNEKSWPYLGHSSDLNPVCEPCRKNITSGNTTKLVVRDVTGCAICSKYCSKKFVTYWASELESLFIGESCIKKLQNPVKKHSEEITALKFEKIKKLVDLAVESVNLPHNTELLQLHKRSTSSTTENVNTVAAVGQSQNCSDSLGIGGENTSNTVESPSSHLADWSEPLTRASVVSSSQPVAGSFKIMGSSVTPFTTITSSGKGVNSDELPPPPVTQMVRVGSRNPIPGSFSMRLPKPNSEFIRHKPVPNNFAILGSNIKAGQFPLQPTTVVRVGAQISEAQSKENPTHVEEPTQGMNCIRIQNGGNVLSSVSPSQLNLNGGIIRFKTSTKTPNSTPPPPANPPSDGSKFVIKYASHGLPKSVKEKTMDAAEQNKPIVIKTSSKCSRPKSNEVAPPRIAHVIRTQNHVFNSKIVETENIKSVSVRVVTGSRSKPETVTLD